MMQIESDKLNTAGSDRWVMTLQIWTSWLVTYAVMMIVARLQATGAKPTQPVSSQCNRREGIYLHIQACHNQVGIWIFHRIIVCMLSVFFFSGVFLLSLAAVRTFRRFNSEVNFLVWRPLTSHGMLLIVSYCYNCIGHVISCAARHVTFMWSGLTTVFGILGVIISSLEITFPIDRNLRNISSERKVCRHSFSN